MRNTRQIYWWHEGRSVIPSVYNQIDIVFPLNLNSVDNTIIKVKPLVINFSEPDVMSMDIFTPRTYCGQSSNILYEGIQLISHPENNAISNNWNMQSIRKIFVTSLMNIPVEYTHGMFVINIQFKYTRQIFVWNIRHLNVCLS